MIVTEQKPLQEIIDSLAGYTKIFLVGCGECATTCKSGGKEELSAIKKALEENGKMVVAGSIPDAPCISAQIKIELAKNVKELQQAEAILVLACGLGVQSVRDNDRLGKAVYPACNTLFGAVVDAAGNFLEKCSLCGECVLGVTAGICPITLCPKGLLNGPCGGMDRGKCEVDKERDCAWVLIYRELEKKKNLQSFKKVQGPKDFKKTTRPHKLITSRQESRAA